jgi:hypothetical protein
MLQRALHSWRSGNIPAFDALKQRLLLKRGWNRAWKCQLYSHLLRRELNPISLSRGESNPVKAVLKAADDWVSGLEALIAVQQVSNETEAEHEAVDIAGTRLVLAVTRWRSERKGWLTSRTP